VAVVCDLDAHTRICGFQPDLNAPRARMLEGIVQRLHSDAIQIMFDAGWQLNRIVQAKLRCESGSGLDRRQPSSQCLAQSDYLQQRLAQLEYQKPHFIERVSGRSSDIVQVSAGSVDVTSPKPSGRRFCP